MSAHYKVACYARRSWSRAAAITTGRTDAANQGRAKSRTLIYVSGSRRSLLAVAKPTVALESLMSWVVQEDATASPGSCARSDSTLGNALSIEPLPLTAATADPLPLIGSEVSPCSGLIRYGPPMPLACSQVKVGCIWLRSLICSPAGLSVGPCIKSSMLALSLPRYAWRLLNVARSNLSSFTPIAALRSEER